MSLSGLVKGFHDLTIVASNVAELRRFYASLGFTQVVDQGEELAVFLVGANELAIHTSVTKPSEALVLSVAVSDLAGVKRCLSDLGIEFLGPAPMRPGLVGVSIRDPNGNKIEFVAPAGG